MGGTPEGHGAETILPMIHDSPAPMRIHNDSYTKAAGYPGALVSAYVLAGYMSELLVNFFRRVVAHHRQVRAEVHRQRRPARRSGRLWRHGHERGHERPAWASRHARHMDGKSRWCAPGDRMGERRPALTAPRSRRKPFRTSSSPLSARGLPTPVRSIASPRCWS